MEFNCSCCGHTDFSCECLNKPGPWDSCQRMRPYGCKSCGRNYWIHHSEAVSPVGEDCSGPECDGNLVLRVAGHPYVAYNLYGTEHPNPPIPPMGPHGPGRR